MPRYIDKDALLHKMQEQYEDFEECYGKYNDVVVGFSDAMQLLEDEPEINGQGIFCGHWIGQPISGYADCRCSVCGAVCNVHVSAGIPTQRYCYRCGAKMDGGESIANEEEGRKEKK